MALGLVDPPSKGAAFASISAIFASMAIGERVDVGGPVPDECPRRGTISGAATGPGASTCPGGAKASKQASRVGVTTCSRLTAAKFSGAGEAYVFGKCGQVL